MYVCMCVYMYVRMHVYTGFGLGAIIGIAAGGGALLIGGGVFAYMHTRKSSKVRSYIHAFIHACIHTYTVAYIPALFNMPAATHFMNSNFYACMGTCIHRLGDSLLY